MYGEDPNDQVQLPRGGFIDLRVAKGFGTRDYNQVRISVISTNATPPVDGFFKYSERFKHKWTQFYLHSTLATVDERRLFDIPFETSGARAQVHLPAQGAGVAGLFIADPCINSPTGRNYQRCPYGDKFETATRIPRLINAFAGNVDTDYWAILGDNFYDRSGDITAHIFERMSAKVQSKLFLSCPGNHDYWISGNPIVSTTTDQCGNGYMQYYVQDTKAAEKDAIGAASPFNLEVDPGSGRFLTYGCTLPDVSNFQWYTQIGNVGIIGQSGAHSASENAHFEREACEWLARQPLLDLAVLVGHWDLEGMGASDSMSVPGMFARMAKLPGCRQFDDRGMFKFVTGHTHCNTPHPYNERSGFRTAGFGMAGCGNFGVPILDTSGGSVRFWYFDTSTDQLYQQAIECTELRGWRNCLHLATLWLEHPIVARTSESVNFV